jgi:hypothetical protein
VELTIYSISYKTKFGTVSAESENPEDLIGAHEKLKDLAFTVGAGNARRKISPKKSRDALSVGRSGTGETAAVLREIEVKILSSNFFATPKTTGETREKLHDVTGKYFTSRKVSQALGILREKRELSRTGKRNSYLYSLR